METSDIIATIGVGLLLIAFFLLSFRVIKSDDWLYLVLNLLGASIAGYASWTINFLPFVVLEFVWVLVALIGLIKLFLSKKTVSRETAI